MTKEELQDMIEVGVEKAVKKYVNGKIDRLDTKLDAHIAEVLPYLQGAAGFRILWKVLAGIAGAFILADQLMSLGVIKRFFGM